MSYKLMLVENDIVLSKAIQEYLIDQGFNVYIANNGLEALNLAYQYNFDLIISDIMMPLVNGYELLAKLKKNKALSKIPVIDPAVNREGLAVVPSRLDGGRRAHVVHLLQHVQLHQAVHARVKVVNGRQLDRVAAADITDVRQPVVNKANALVAHRRLDTTAVVVANDQDVAHLEDLDGVLNDRQDVEVL